jgi:hypothetical protein
MVGAEPIYARHIGYVRAVDSIKRNIAAPQVDKPAMRVMPYRGFVHPHGTRCRIAACGVQVSGISGSLPASLAVTEFGRLPSFDVLHRTPEHPPEASEIKRRIAAAARGQRQRLAEMWSSFVGLGAIEALEGIFFNGKVGSALGRAEARR